MLYESRYYTKDRAYMCRPVSASIAPRVGAHGYRLARLPTGDSLLATLLLSRRVDMRRQIEKQPSYIRAVDLLGCTVNVN
jgi:hypothetical protein